MKITVDLEHRFLPQYAHACGKSSTQFFNFGKKLGNTA